MSITIRRVIIWLVTLILEYIYLIFSSLIINPNNSFTIDGVETNVQNYYEERYKPFMDCGKLKYPFLPTANFSTNRSKPDLVPAELVSE